MRKEKIKELIIFSAFIVIVVLIYDYPKILTYRPQATHQWRQVDGASIALNYYEDSLSFFKPAIQLTSENGNNKAVGEFPIIYFTVAILWKIFGFHEFIFRLLSLIVVFVGLFYLFRLLKNLTNNNFWSISITALLFSSPILVYYSNSFIPNPIAFSLVIIGWYYFYRFVKEEKTRFLYVCLLLFLIGGLLKVSSLISYCIIFLLYILETIRLIKTREGLRVFSKPVKQIVPFILIPVVIFAWYKFSNHYNNTNFSGIFLQDISPIWKCNFMTINKVLDRIYNAMLPQFYNNFLLHLILFIFLFLIFNYKKVNKLLFLVMVCSLAGSLAYFLLFFSHFEYHDYYQIELLIFPFSVLVTFIHFLVSNYSNVLENRNLKILVCLLVFCCIVYTAAYNRIKYNTYDIFARYAFFIDENIKANYDYEQTSYFKNWKALESITPYLRSLDIKSSDRVISLPDYSVNITLYLMDQKGFNNFSSGPFEDDSHMKKIIRLGAKYLIINQPAWLERISLKPYMKYKIGQYKNVSIFDLRPYLAEGFKQVLPVKVNATQDTSNQDQNIYYCDAESRSDDKSLFLGSNNSTFEYGLQQSNEKAHSGHNSIKLTNSSPYGMAITFEAVSYGSVFEISVWRYSTEPCGVIVASATKSEIFYNAESTELEKDANGWQYLKKTIFIPTQLPGNSLTIYLWNNGKFPVYFDDLKIIRK